MTTLEFERRERGLSQHDLARAAGLGIGAVEWIGYVEGGFKPKRIGSRAFAIGAALGVAPEALALPVNVDPVTATLEAASV